jgi:hypothetical protein
MHAHVQVLGQEISDSEARRFLEVLDTDASGTIECAELVQGSLFGTGSGFQDVFKLWAQDPDFFYMAGHVKSATPTPLYVTALAGLLSGGCRLSTTPSSRTHSLSLPPSPSHPLPLPRGSTSPRIQSHHTLHSSRTLKTTHRTPSYPPPRLLSHARRRHHGHVCVPLRCPQNQAPGPEGRGDSGGHPRCV